MCLSATHKAVGGGGGVWRDVITKENLAHVAVIHKVSCFLPGTVLDCSHSRYRTGLGELSPVHPAKNRFNKSHQLHFRCLCSAIGSCYNSWQRNLANYGLSIQFFTNMLLQED